MHDCLGMAFEFEDGKAKINMTDCLKNMLNEFLIKFENASIASPAGVDAFEED